MRRRFALALTLSVALSPVRSEVARAQSAWTADTLSVVTPTATLAGTLVRPAGGGRHPVVLLIAGSGPTDRDGNSPLLPGANNSLRLLAEDLARRGIASVRYDKRFLGGSHTSVTNEADLRFEMLAADAAAWLRRLRADSSFCSVVVAGHSEGALLGALAARDVPVDAIVSIAGPARRASVEIREQLVPKLPAASLSALDSVLHELEAGRTVDSMPKRVWLLGLSLFRPSVQPYLISWFRYDPIAVLRADAVPTLVVQGTTDIQVPASDTAVYARELPAAERLVIDGMNHVLKAVPADSAAQLKSYGDPSLPLAPGLVDGIAAFVERHAGCASRRAATRPGTR